MPGLDEISIKAFFKDVWSEEIVKYQGKDEKNRLTLPFSQYLMLLSEVALVEEVRYTVHYSFQMNLDVMGCYIICMYNTKWKYAIYVHMYHTEWKCAMYLICMHVHSMY